MSDLPEYLTSMVRRDPPLEGIIVPSSTPVVSFGDFRSVRVATLGINPSNREFESSRGQLLAGTERRLSTLESLQASSLGELNNAQVARVIEDCNNYFQGNDYTWFKTLDTVLRSSLNVSFFDGTACHLDLVQWSTRIKWGSLDSHTQACLMEDGRPHLDNQLSNSDISLVVVNGSAVWRELEKAGFGDPEIVGELKFSRAQTRCTLKRNRFGKTLFVGWTANLQSQPGANSRVFLMELAEKLTQLAEGSA